MSQVLQRLIGKGVLAMQEFFKKNPNGLAAYRQLIEPFSRLGSAGNPGIAVASIRHAEYKRNQTGPDLQKLLSTLNEVRLLGLLDSENRLGF